MAAGPITTVWKSFTPDHTDADTLPATLGTPEGAWTYGAGTDPIETDVPAEVVVTVEALKGKIGLCLISEDYSKLASSQVLVTPQQGKTTVVLAFAPAKSPARILLRNYADGGNKGEARIEKAEIRPVG